MLWKTKFSGAVAYFVVTLDACHMGKTWTYFSAIEFLKHIGELCIITGDVLCKVGHIQVNAESLKLCAMLYSWGSRNGSYTLNIYR